MTMKTNLRLPAPLIGVVVASLALATAGCESTSTPTKRQPVASQPVGAVQSRSESAGAAADGRDRPGQAPAATLGASCRCGAQPFCGRHASAGHGRSPSGSHDSPSCASGPGEGLCTGGVAAVETDRVGDTLGLAEPIPVGAKARCPVMGNEFTVTEATARSEHEGQHYAFCCPGCKPKFDGAPNEYL